MDKEWLGTGMYRFREGDEVAITSQAACSNIATLPPKAESLVASVHSVTPTGDVRVEFGKGFQCTVAPEHLFKMRRLLPGDLVKLVDDVRGDGNLKLANRHKLATQAFGQICLVLRNFSRVSDKIFATVGHECKLFCPFHLDFVARPLYGDFMARVNQYASQCLVDNLLTALEKSMLDLPVIDTSPCSKSSIYMPGSVVKVSSDVEQFIRWHLLHSIDEFWDPFTAPFRTLQDYACFPLDGYTYSTFPAEQIVSLLEPGKVVDVNSDGDAIVEFSDGRAWSVRTRFLRLADGPEARGEGRSSCSKELSPETQRLLHGTLSDKPQALLLPACFFGKMEWINYALEGNASLECGDQTGNTPLHYAAHGNQPDVIKFLLCKGVNINATNQHRNTALHFAVKEGFLKCVRELTKHYLTLDPNIQDNNGNTALHVAIAKMNADIVNELADLHEVDFSIRNQYGLNTLHMAALKGNCMAAENILSGRADLINDKQGDQGYAALHFAAMTGHHGVVEALLKKEACSVDVENKDEETALLLAARKGHWAIVESLLFAGANINKPDKDGNTVLHMTLKDVPGQSTKAHDKPTSHAMKVVEKKIQEIYDFGVDNRLPLACFLAQSGGDIRYCNKAGTSPLKMALSMEKPAAEMLGFFSVSWCDAESGTCKRCFDMPANTSFSPCEHRLYCDHCGQRMKRCPACGTYIVGRVVNRPTTPLVPEHEKVQVLAAKPTNPPCEAYTMEKKPRGMCIVINNIDFWGNLEQQQGAEQDAERMKSLFTQLYFDVTEVKNISSGDMLLRLVLAANTNEQETADCLALIILTGGKEDTIYCEDGNSLSLHHDIFPRFNDNNCPALKGKPKLFFIQFYHRAERSNATKDSAVSFLTGTGSDKPSIGKDMFCAYSTVSGCEDLGNRKYSSSFLAVVQKVFCRYGATHSIRDLMSQLNDEWTRSSATDIKSGMVHWEASLAKALYFNPGYDR